MLANMATSLILHKRIKTTTAKARALRMYVEPLITKSKEDSTHSRRVVFSYLKNKFAVSELFREVSTKVAERPGGYTRILKTGTRLGDNADMCIIELVDYNENLLAAKDDAAKKTTRRRRRKTTGTTQQGEEKQTKAKKAVEAKPEEKAQEVAEEKKVETVAEAVVEEQEVETKAEETPKEENSDETSEEEDKKDS